MTAVSGTKIQRAGVRSERVVYVSYLPDRWTQPVRDALVAKFRKEGDKFRRPVFVISDVAGTAGERADVPRWDPHVPTDVIVLLSDEYREKFINEQCAEIDDMTHELNVVLRRRAAVDDLEDFNIWLGIVQRVTWHALFIEGKQLAEFGHLLHELLAGNKFRNGEFLDDDAFEAAVAIRQHRAADCAHCKRSMRPHEAPSLFSRWFKRRT